jgi:peptidoglycan LD-endopeptidase LytH
MAKAIRFALATALLAAILILAYPWISAAIYSLRLTLMPAPASLPMPVAGVAKKAIRDTWHASRPPARRHEGIDIFAEKGTPVLSSTEGIVIRREETSLGGHVIWVLGPAGHQHYYAHLDQPALLDTRDRVQVGTLLGYVGNTGNAKTTPPHLHYGIYTGSGPVNPYPFLTAQETGP